MKHSLLFLLLLNTISLYSQYIYSDTTWERWFGEQGNLEASSTFKHDIEHYDRSYVFAGYDGGYASYNAFLKKTDINGFFLWERRLDLYYKKNIHSIKNYHDGGVLISGRSDYNGIPNPWVAKLNACMEVEWCYIFSWPKFSYANDIAEDQNGDIIVLAYGKTKEERLNLIKIAPDGTILWENSYANQYDYPYTSNAFGYELFISNDNNYYIAGEIDWPTNNDPNQGWGTRALFVKVNSEGGEEWVLPFGIYDNLYSTAHSTWQANENLFVSVCINHDSINPALVYFNSSGEELGYSTKKIMPETYAASDFIYSKPIGSGMFFSIWRYYDSDFNPFNGYMIYDSLLNIIDYKETPDILMPCNLIKTFNHKIVTVAHMKEQDDPLLFDTYLNKQNVDLTYDSVYTAWTGTYDSLCEEGIVPGFLPYSCDVIVGIDEIPSPDQYKEAQEKIDIQVQPNPGQSQTSLILENTAKFKNIELEIFNMAGEQQYYKKLLTGTGEVPINIGNWPTGVYFIIIRSNGKMVGDSKMSVVR